MIAIALLLCTGTLFAALYALGKAGAAAGMIPAAILLWQVAGGALGLAVVAAWKRDARPPLSGRHLRYYLVSGVLGVSVPNVLAYFAVHKLEVGVVALMVALSPLFTYAGALLLRMERFHPLRLVGCLLGLMGVALLSAPSGERSLDAAGLLAALGAPMFLAAGNLYRTRAWPAGTPPLALASGMLWLQLPLVALGFAIFDGGTQIASEAALPVLLTIAALAPVSYGAAFALQKLGGVVFYSQLGYVMTVAGVLFGYIFFGERLGPPVWMAAALVLVGVLLVNRSVYRRGAAPIAGRPASTAH